MVVYDCVSMRELELASPWVFAGVIILLWTAIFALMDILLPFTLSNTVVSGIAGGIAFAISSLFVQQRDVS